MVVLIIGLGSISKKHISAIYSICENPIIIALRSEYSKDDTDGVISIKKINELWKRNLAKRLFGEYKNEVQGRCNDMQNSYKA